MQRNSHSTIDLIILGFLHEAPMSAYDLAKHIEKRHANKVLKISTPAVYKNCRRLLQAAYVGQKSSIPKNTLHITATGRQYFLELMSHFATRIAPFYLESNTFLYHIHTLKPEKALALLRRQEAELLLLKKWIIAHEREMAPGLSFGSRAIVRQYRMMLTTLCLWCKEVIKDYKREHKNT